MQKKQLNNIIQKITELSKEDKASFLDYLLSNLTNDDLNNINGQITNINTKIKTIFAEVNKINAFNNITLSNGYGNYEKTLYFVKNKVNLFHTILKNNIGLIIQSGMYEVHLFIDIDSNSINKTITIAETYSAPTYFPNSLKFSDIDTSTKGTYYIHIIKSSDEINYYTPWYLDIQKIK